MESIITIYPSFTAFRCAYCYELNPARKTKPNITTRVSTGSILPPPIAAEAPLSETTGGEGEEKETAHDNKNEEEKEGGEHDAKGIEEKES